MAPHDNDNDNDNHNDNDSEYNKAPIVMSTMTIQPTHYQIESIVSNAITTAATSPHLPIRSILKKTPTTFVRASTRKAKTVQFDSLQIRTFPQILGDHPCCSRGLPLSLAWEYTSQHTLSINEHDHDPESEKVPFKSHSLRLGADRRLEILKNARLEILKKASSATLRIKATTTHTNTNTNTIESSSFDCCKSGAISPLHQIPTHQTDLISAEPPSELPASALVSPVRSFEDVDGIAIESLNAMYSEVELKRAERKIWRQRNRMRKSKVAQRFFDAPIHAE